MNIPENWRAILDHLAKLRDAKDDAPKNRHHRTHARIPATVNKYAHAEMRRRTQQRKG
jgi:predicted ATPase